MTQPSSSASILTRRLGPLPVFVWLLLFVGMVALVIWWRRRNAASSANSVYSGVNTAPSFSPAGYMTQPSTSTAKQVMATTEQSGHNHPWWELEGGIYGVPVDENGLPPLQPMPVPRTRSVTYPVTSRDPSSIVAISRRHGFSGTRGQTRVYPDGGMVVPQ